MDIPLSRILVPTDFSEEARTALSYGVALAERLGGTLHVLHVVEAVVNVSPLPQEFGARDELDRAIGESAWGELNQLLSAEDRKRLKVEFAVEWGIPFTEIVRYAQARRVDLIAMGTHGRGGVKHLILGSVAENVVRGAPCPVLTVRHLPPSARNVAA
jgi:nucleotide-binding universal stress UspA family protein